MRNLSLLIIFGSILFSCRQQAQINKRELKSIYSDILNHDSLKGRYYLIDSIENFETKTIIQSDTTYYIANCDFEKGGIWTQKLFDSLMIISFKKLHSNSGFDGFGNIQANYSFSLPYFGKDKQTLLVYYRYYCGNLCAEYSLRQYRKINSRWIYVKTYISIIS